MKKTQCNKCKNWFSNKGSNYNRHNLVCDGTYIPFIKSKKCKYCSIDFDAKMSSSERANHTRWCSHNPKKYLYRNNTETARKYITEESRKSAGEAIKKAHKEGKYTNSYKKGIKTRIQNCTNFHTEATKKVIREKALASNHRRLKKGTIEYRGVLLDSSWELKLAKRLDDLGIMWKRPDFIFWADNEGTIHKYFPDFFLPEYNLYLDPKNPYAYNVQKEKIKILLTQIENLVILTTEEQCELYDPRKY